MSERMLKRVLVILGVLVLVYGAVRVGAYATKPGSDSGGALGTALERLRGDTLVSATVVPPNGERLEIRRDSSGWTVNAFRADSIAVDRLLRAVREAATGDIVAQSADNHARLGVSSDSAWTATLRTRRDSAVILIGDQGPSWGTTYARLPAEDVVYSVRGGLREALAVSLSDWRDRTIARTDTAAVRTVVLERDRKSVRIERADSVWKAASGGKVDSLRMADVLSELARFDATGFAPDSTKFTGKDARRVVALGASGDTLAAIEFLSDSSSSWLARSRGGGQIYQVPLWRVDRIVPQVDSIVRR